MNKNIHTFHIPVMGIGHSVDTPVRVAHFGISSVISIVNDFLLEKIREYYCNAFAFPYVQISMKEEDARAKRIKAYLELVQKIVGINMEKTRDMPFFQDNDKKKYFDMLPDNSHLKKMYNDLLKMESGPERDMQAGELTQKMMQGSIDVNIMVKLDKINYDRDGGPLPDEFSDAKAALRGFAESSLESSIVFSAGLNKSLFSYMAQFKDFYRDETYKIKKKIIIKVSDFRSALIQGRFLARKGLEVYEYRIESGLNCGGHAFASNGLLLPEIMQEFKENRELLLTEFQPVIRKFYEKNGWPYPDQVEPPLITVQGGIGNYGENCRLLDDFNMDMTGWASPFLLVPEATPVDAPTRKLLEKSGEKDLFLSNVSPLGIPFNNIHNTGSEIKSNEWIKQGKPGSPCPKKYLVSNTEFGDKPICYASRQYQAKKLKEISMLTLSPEEREQRFREITDKSCICDHLSNGALIALGIAEEKNAPALVCPGPNIQWFNRSYTLKEMVDHIYGRGISLVPAERPHMFANELVIYVNYFENMLKKCEYTDKSMKAAREFKDNLRKGIAFCLKIAESKAYPGENLASLKICAERENKRLKIIYLTFKANYKFKKVLENGVMEVPSDEMALA